MGAQPFWDGLEGGTADQTWQTFWLDEEPMPGVARVKGDLTRKLEVKKTKGKDGANIKDNGYQPSKFTVELTIWNNDQWQSFQDMLPRIHPRKKGGVRDPFKVAYPSLTLVGIHQAILESIKLPVPGDDFIATVEMAFIEKEAPAEVKTGGKGGGRGGSSAARRQQIIAEINQLEAEKQDLLQQAAYHEELGNTGTADEFYSQAARTADRQNELDAELNRIGG